MIKKILLPAAPLVITIILLERFNANGAIPAYLLPAPSEIWGSLVIDAEDYLVAVRTTLFEALSGLFISIVFGVMVAILLSLSKVLEAAFYPYAVFFQTVPLISIAPILVIWFGYGSPTVIASAFIVSVFPMIINSLAGIRATDPALMDLFRLYGATRLQTLLKLRVPNAVPQIVTGIRVSSGLALIGAIVGEFIGGGGLGGLIDAARTQQRLDRVFAAVLISSLIGMALLGALSLFVRFFLWRWRELRD